MALAAELHGATRTGTARLRIKESDRARAMARELARLGGEVEVEADRVRVRALPLHPPTEPLCGHNDHRIVMALSILLTRYGGEIDGAEAVAKSLPDFFERLQALGIGMTV
jgi:3-phosphoshikimate 1-carboxyvinyltransferase